MGAVFDSVTVIVPGAAASSYRGRLAIADGEIAFREAASGPDDKPLFTWRVPRLEDGPEGPALKVITAFGAVSIQVGPLDRLAIITLSGEGRERVLEVLIENGLPRVVGSLTVAAEELTSLRGWALMFILIGLSNSGQGLHALTGFGMTAVGLWALFCGPRVAILAANGLLLLALAGKNMQFNGPGFWPVILGILGVQQLWRWQEIRPLLAVPANRAWLQARLSAPHTAAADVPAGYIARTIAFILSGVCAACGGLMALGAVFSRDPGGIALALLGLAMAGWFLLVTALPHVAMNFARRTFPANGPMAVLVYPFVMGMCLLMLSFKFLPPVVPKDDAGVHRMLSGDFPAAPAP